MKPLLCFAVLLVGFSCSGQNLAAPGSMVTFIPDSMLAGVLLCDTASAINVLGRISSKGFGEGHYDMPHASFFNRDSTEILTVFLHYGGYLNEYCELRISELEKGSVLAALPMERFSSGRGVKLGLSEAEIAHMFGDKAVRGIGKNGRVLLKYAIKDFASSPFLQRFNYPSYYAHFTFEHDRLVDYRFGFEYP